LKKLYDVEAAIDHNEIQLYKMLADNINSTENREKMEKIKQEIEKQNKIKEQLKN
jgi:hypothetical protein